MTVCAITARYAPGGAEEAERTTAEADTQASPLEVDQAEQPWQWEQTQLWQVDFYLTRLTTLQLKRCGDQQ